MHEQIKIDKNIPTPSGATRFNPKYPFRQMDIGDSFFVPTTAENHHARKASLSTLARRITIETKHVFTVRRCDDGLRVWRVK